MKKIILALLTSALTTNVDAQQLIKNLQTGINDTWPWGIPVTNPDDTWSVKLPNSAVYQNAFVSTGLNPAYALNYQTIDPNVSVISPAIYTVAGSNFNEVPGDLFPGGVVGQYIYRASFNYVKSSCNTITNSYITITTLTGGTQVTDFMLNGYSQSILNANLPFLTALAGPAVTPYSFPINYGDLVNGTNYIYITVDVTQAHVTHGAGLMINGQLEINTIPVYASPNIFNLAGSTTAPVCVCQQGLLNVTVGAGQNPANFSLQVAGPNSYNYNGSVPAALSVYPGSYSLTLTNLVCGGTSNTNYVLNLKTNRCPCGKPGVETGLTDESVPVQFSVSPNPSAGVFSLKTNSNENGTLKIYNVSGSLVKQMVMDREISDYEIDLTGFANGMYFLNVDSENIHSVVKLIRE